MNSEYIWWNRHFFKYKITSHTLFIMCFKAFHMEHLLSPMNEAIWMKDGPVNVILSHYCGLTLALWQAECTRKDVERSE